MTNTPVECREYGDAGRTVLVLHGGPGAPGYMAPVARGLAGSFRVLEPLQRKSGAEPLSVARHVADLLALIDQRCQAPPALVGHSWGAMLALAFAAAHPDRSAALVLIGCGTFDRMSRRRLETNRQARIDDALRRRLDRLADEFPDPDERLRAMADLTVRLYSCDLISIDHEVEGCDARAYEETWADMLRLQESGVYPKAFSAIRAPVIMLHGADDPHPGGMIRAGLAPHLPRLEYRQWDRCGHYPWLEKAARADFFDFLHMWLGSRLPGRGGRTGV